MSDLARAKKLYRGFREREPTRIKRVSLPPMPRAVVIVGYCDFIGYTTTHGRKAARYTHEFAARSRPLLCTDGRRLYLVGGKFRFTSRGIVDLDARGLEEP